MSSSEDRCEEFDDLKEEADDGDDEAMVKVGKMLIQGISVPVDKKKAIAYYKNAIDKGNSEAMLIEELLYAKALLTGDGVSIDKENALKYCKMSVDKGNSDAINMYASIR